MTKSCDNISACHEPTTIGEDQNALRVICKECKTQYVIRKEPLKGNPEKRRYIKIFKKDALQGNDNLLYKYHPRFLKT